MPRCPICKNRLSDPPTRAADPPSGPTFAPFCSERCKLIDLGNWFGEAYGLATSDESGGLDDDELYDPRLS